MQFLNDSVAHKSSQFHVKFHGIHFPDIDDCVEAPCKNGGSCEDGVASFSCLCGPGFTGELCQSSNVCRWCGIVLMFVWTGVDWGALSVR